MRFWDFPGPWLGPLRGPNGLDLNKLENDIQGLALAQGVPVSLMSSPPHHSRHPRLCRGRARQCPRRPPHRQTCWCAAFCACQAAPQAAAQASGPPAAAAGEPAAAPPTTPLCTVSHLSSPARTGVVARRMCFQING